ncbi:hypothetical protein BIFGAL_02706 [Bifidobacterium gallicum DSM 20093 = LMG 11596]|uniref:Uncharacterized protein n=1 Tax=Bifidobacterium gallicum DSM 20093 = LMG 11596 TaxID=561180 RepID=D1NSE9_9BIFI|nr:hypothetical protein BIFGAL_02706 [Bifidobacterium gallicum DSM 20093 = LMG 11596]KFI58667.1 hypothetical protein BGLCM_0958 [Bifidobacterium gallicum DSM 20093 = LMG 11596]
MHASALTDVIIELQTGTVLVRFQFFSIAMPPPIAPAPTILMRHARTNETPNMMKGHIVDMALAILTYGMSIVMLVD